MRSAVAIAVACSLWSCSDEKSEPGVGPDVSWQLYCAPITAENPGGTCNVTELRPHGPLDGRDLADKADDYPLEVSCSRPSSGFAFKLDDPGRKQDLDKNIDPRPASTIEVTRANPATNECIVQVTEYPLVNPSPRLLQDACSGNPSNPGTCKLAGSFDADGYSFVGTLECAGLRYKNQGDPAWTLHAPSPNSTAPVTIQLSHCD